MTTRTPAKRHSHTRARGLAALTLCFGLLACRQEPAGSQPPPAQATDPPRRAATTNVDASRRTAIVEAIERVSPSVVSI
ncbi:MAG: hypothetical protein ACREMH_00910, partial [Gemmatimonadales bacterium]